MFSARTRRDRVAIVNALQTKISGGMSRTYADRDNQVAQALESAADVSTVLPDFADWLLTDPKDGLLRIVEVPKPLQLVDGKRPDTRGQYAIERVARLCRERSTDQTEWSSAANFAYAAAAREEDARKSRAIYTAAHIANAWMSGNVVDAVMFAAEAEDPLPAPGPKPRKIVELEKADANSSLGERLLMHARNGIARFDAWFNGPIMGDPARPRDQAIFNRQGAKLLQLVQSLPQAA